VLQNRKKKNSFEWSLADERGRRQASGYIPFKEISIRESLSLLGKDFGIAVCTRVVRDPRREVGEAAADVQDSTGGWQLRKRGREAGLAHPPRQEAVEGPVRRHGAVLAPPP